MKHSKEQDSTSRRICIIRHSYYPDIPPTRRNAETLLANGYEVDVICARKKSEKGREVLQGVNIYRLPIEHHRRGALRYVFEYGLFFLFTFWKLMGSMFRKRYDVVEIDAVPDFLVFTTLFLKIRGTKVVLNILDSAPYLFAEKFKASPSNIVFRLLELIERASATYSNHIITPSLTMSRNLERRGLPKSKMTLVLNVPDENIFKLQVSPPRHKNSNGFTLFTHGSLLEKYGIQTLIKAVPILIPHIPNLRVAIVGDGEYRPHLEELVQSLGLDNYVNFLGFVPAYKLPSLISQADIAVIPLHIPMLPSKLFDYASVGQPIIASDFSTMKDFFDESAVMYFRPGDEDDLASCVLELHRNPERRESLSASALAIYENYRWPKSKHKYVKVFKELIEPQPRLQEGSS